MIIKEHGYTGKSVQANAGRGIAGILPTERYAADYP